MRMKIDPTKTAALSLFIAPDKIRVMQNPPIQNTIQNALALDIAIVYNLQSSRFHGWTGETCKQLTMPNGCRLDQSRFGVCDLHAEVCR